LSQVQPVIYNINFFCRYNFFQAVENLYANEFTNIKLKRAINNVENSGM